MATTQDIHAPTLGAQGEPCTSCGAPLAGDQRYCLECGARRTQARVPFRDILATGGAPPAGPAVVAAGRGILDALPPAGAKPTRFTIFFIGNPKGAKLSFSAPPTVLE